MSRKSNREKRYLEKRGGSSGGGSNRGNGNDNQEPELPGMNPSTLRFTSTNAPTEGDIAAWLEARDQPIPEGTSQLLRNRIRDNRAMVTNIFDRAMLLPGSFRGVRDSEGNLQAAAIVLNESKNLYIDFYATAPWNVLRSDRRTAREAGTMLMAELVRESINRGHQGRIRLGSLIGAVSFYTGLGFVEEEDTGEMFLSSQAAQDFLDSL